MGHGAGSASLPDDVLTRAAYYSTSSRPGEFYLSVSLSHCISLSFCLCVGTMSFNLHGNTYCDFNGDNLSDLKFATLHSCRIN